MMKLIGIYKITSKIYLDRIYIGSSINIKKRITQHKTNLKAGKHSSIKLLNHSNKYGFDDLIFEIIELCTIEELNKKEENYIKQLNPYFNISKTADRPMLGRKHTVESKLKMRNNKLNKTVSKETREKISKSLKGKIMPHKHLPLREEHKKRISEGNKGKKVKEDIKLIISKKLIGFKFSEERKEKLKESWKKRKEKNEKINYSSNKKLTIEDVKIIKANYLGNYSDRYIAKVFSISPSSVRKIRKNISYKYVQ